MTAAKKSSVELFAEIQRFKPGSEEYTEAMIAYRSARRHEFDEQIEILRELNRREHEALIKNLKGLIWPCIHLAWIAAAWFLIIHYFDWLKETWCNCQ